MVQVRHELGPTDTVQDLGKGRILRVQRCLWDMHHSVVDGFVCTHALDKVDVLGRAGGDYAQAKLLGELDGDAASPSRAAEDKNRTLLGSCRPLELAIFDQGCMNGRVDERNGRRLDKRQSVGLLDDDAAPGVHGYSGVPLQAAVAGHGHVQAKDCVSDGELVHVRPDRMDYAADIKGGHLGLPCKPANEAQSDVVRAGPEAVSCYQMTWPALALGRSSQLNIHRVAGYRLDFDGHLTRLWCTDLGITKLQGLTQAPAPRECPRLVGHV